MKRIFAFAHLVNIAATAPGDPPVSLRRILTMLALTMPAHAGNDVAVELNTIVNEVVASYMAEKRIPGMSVAIVHEDRIVFAKGYGKASIEFSLPAGAETV